MNLDNCWIKLADIIPWDVFKEKQPLENIEVYAGIEKFSFEAYNEDRCLQEAVERFFSLGERCYGMEFTVTKLEETQLTSIVLSF